MLVCHKLTDFFFFFFLGGTEYWKITAFFFLYARARVWVDI